MESVYKLCFYGGLALAILFLIVTVVLFIVLKIPKVIGDLTGRNAKKGIDEMRHKKVAVSESSRKEKAKYYNQSSGRIKVKDAVSVETRKSNRDETTEELEKSQSGNLQAGDEPTEVLQPGAVYGDDTETDVLRPDGGYGDDSPTDVLKPMGDDSETEVLRPLGDDTETVVLASGVANDDSETEVLRPADGDTATYTDEEATEVLRADGRYIDEDATEVLQTDEPTDVLRADNGDEDATAVLRAESGDEDATAVLCAGDDEEATTVLRSAATGTKKSGIAYVYNVVVTHTNESI